MMSSVTIENAERRSYVLSGYHSHTRKYTETVVVSVKIRLHTVIQLRQINSPRDSRCHVDG